MRLYVHYAVLPCLDLVLLHVAVNVQEAVITHLQQDGLEAVGLVDYLVSTRACVCLCCACAESCLRSQAYLPLFRNIHAAIMQSPLF